MAVVFDKDLTFRQRLGEYDKESLKDIAGYLGLRKLSKLKKAELVDVITEEFLRPEVLFYRAAVLNDREMALIEKGSNGPVSYSEDEEDFICRLSEMDFAAISGELYMIPCDLVEALQKIRTPEFEAYRKRASWVWMCVKFANQFYGLTFVENMLDLVNCKKGFRMTKEELIDVFDHFPFEHVWTIRIDDAFLDLIYADDMDELKRIRTAQADKDYYIPTAAEVKEFYETDALISDKPYQDLLRFMRNELKMDYEEALDILYELWDALSSEDDFHGALQWFADQCEFKNERQFEKLAGLFMAAANGTRMLANRGHKPMELHAKAKLDPNHMPTIVAGSTHAANMLSQIAPDLKKMGFGLDLDSNAGKMPVMEFPNGIQGQPVVSEKKVYPNDPCPCGSGKKYKKCCGR